MALFRIVNESHPKAAQHFWGRPAVPPPLRAAIVPYALLLLPASVAAALNWHWWIAAVLMSPGLAVYVSRAWSAARVQGVMSQDETGQWIVGVIGAPTAVVLADIVRAHAARYSALVFVCYVILVVDPFARAVWRQQRRRGRVPLGSTQRSEDIRTTKASDT